MSRRPTLPKLPRRRVASVVLAANFLIVWVRLVRRIRARVAAERAGAGA